VKVLFTPITSSSIAHTIRCFSVADVLESRGHEVYFTSCNRRYDFIKNSGYKVVSVYPEINVNDPDDQSVNFLASKQDKIYEWFSSEIKATKEIKPDVVVSAPAIFGPYVYYATGIPVVSIMDIQYLGDYSKGLMGISLSTERMKDKLLNWFLRPIFEKKFIILYLNEIMKVYKRLGIRWDFESRNEVYKPMGVIIPSDRYTQPPRGRRNNMYYVGPIFWEGFEKMDTGITEDTIVKFKGNDKLIYLMFGGSIFDKDIYEKLINIIFKLNYKCIVGLGPNFDTNQFKIESDRLIIRKYVPGMHLSKLCDLSINTGSQGTVMQGLWWGKPQIAIPLLMDQAFYANRLEEMNLGINANPKSILKFSKRENFSIFNKDTISKVEKGISKIFEDDLYFKRARRFKLLLRKYKNPAKKASILIENFVKVCS